MHLYQVKFMESYSGFPIYYYFKRLDSIIDYLNKLYPSKRVVLNETYFIRIIYVNENAEELEKVLD